VNAAAASLQLQGFEVQGVVVKVAPGPCHENGTCQNGSTCYVHSTNGVVANFAQCICASNNYSGNNCDQCNDANFITNQTSADVSGVLGEIEISFIESCAAPHTVNWSTVGVVRRETNRQCDTLGLLMHEENEELQGLTTELLYQGGCAGYNTEYASFASNWNAKVQSAESKLEQYQAIYGAILAVTQGAAFQASDQTIAQATAGDAATAALAGLDKDACYSRFSDAKSHNSLDTNHPLERTEISRNGSQDRVDILWNTVRPIYLGCTFDSADNKKDLGKAWGEFASDFGVSASRRLQGPSQTEARRLDATVGDSGSIWKEVSSMFE